MVTIEVFPGECLAYVARKAVEAAAFTGEDASFTFDNMPMVIRPDDSIDGVVRRYREKEAQ